MMESSIDMHLIISPDESQDQILEIVMLASVPFEYVTDAEG